MESQPPEPPPVKAPETAPSVFKLAVEGAMAVMMPATFQTLRRRELGIPEHRYQLPAAITTDVASNLIALYMFATFGGFDGSLTAIGIAAGMKITSLFSAEALFNPKPNT